MGAYSELQARLKTAPKTWLVTGVAGFIGSNLLEALLKLEQHVIGFDNLSTGKRENLEEVRSSINSDQWGRFRFVEGDTSELASCQKVCAGAHYVLHQAA